MNELCLIELLVLNSNAFNYYALWKQMNNIKLDY